MLGCVLVEPPWRHRRRPGRQGTTIPQVRACSTRSGTTAPSDRSKERRSLAPGTVEHSASMRLKGVWKSPYDPRLSDPRTSRKPPVTPPRRPYATDLTDAEWHPPAYSSLLPSRVAVRPSMTAASWSTPWPSGCGQAAPGGCPMTCRPWQTVYHYFCSWRQQGLWEQVHRPLHVQERTRRQGREPTPSAAILDSQGVKTTEPGATRLRRCQAA
jgi:hypothetical protein